MNAVPKTCKFTLPEVVAAPVTLIAVLVLVEPSEVPRTVPAPPVTASVPPMASGASAAAR